MTKEQIRKAEQIIYNSPQKFIDAYENGGEQFKEFMMLLALADQEKRNEAKRILKQELKRAKGQATK